MDNMSSTIIASMMAIGTIAALYMIIAVVRVELKKRRSEDGEEKGDMKLVTLIVIIVIGIFITLARTVLTMLVS